LAFKFKLRRYTSDICSLRGGVDRLTFSVFIRFDAETCLPVGAYTRPLFSST
jgi:hypothetical protein